MNSFLENLKNRKIAPEIKDYWMSLVDGNLDRLDEETRTANSIVLNASKWIDGLGEIWFPIAVRRDLSLTTVEEIFFFQADPIREFKSQSEFVRFLKLRSFE